jgi:hypothetical protein
MTCESGGYRMGARVTYTKVRSNGMVDAVSHITTSFVRLDMKLGPYIRVMYLVLHLACRIKDSISQLNRDADEEIVNALS